VSSAPIITSRDLAYLRALASPSPITRPIKSIPQDPIPIISAYASIHPSLNLYLCDLFSATRHHPELDGTLLTLRAQGDAEDLARAFRVVGGSTLGVDLITRKAHITREESDISDSQRDTATSEEDDSVGWGDNAPGENAILMSLHDHEVAAVGTRLIPPGGGASSTMPLNGEPSAHHARAASSSSQVWDVSEVDIARIFPRVVSHRLKVRDGPDDEVLGSVMFPAALGQEETDMSYSRRSVKDILVNVLASV